MAIATLCVLCDRLREKDGMWPLLLIAALANPHDIYTYLFLFHEGNESVRNREIRDKEKLRDKQFPVRHFPQVFLVQ